MMITMKNRNVQIDSFSNFFINTLSNHSVLIYSIIFVAIVIFIMYIFFQHTFNNATILKRNQELIRKLGSTKLETLVNGSGINNIPKLNIITNNPSLKAANDCGKGPVYIGEYGTTRDCIRVCDNIDASVINVNKGSTYTFQSSVLNEGAHCILGPAPSCNDKTTDVILSVNSHKCLSKFPNILGGKIGNTVIACKNSIISDPQNYLWDYKTNTRFDPITTVFYDEDELLPDGTYRFRCKFNGFDRQHNNFIPHPFNRFHPIRDYCKEYIFRAHPDVHMKMAEDRSNFECECGDESVTRVKNIDPHDKSSPCGFIQNDIKSDVKERKIATIIYKCFNIDSPLEDVAKYVPCPEDSFIRSGPGIASVQIPFTSNPLAAIEHPLYAQMSTGLLAHKLQTNIDNENDDNDNA